MIARAALLVAQLAVLFVVVAFVVELIQRRMGAGRVRAWMGGRPMVAALKGIAVGFVTPFCTYSAIPVLVGLRQAGVPAAGYVAFIAAAPVLDPVLFAALALIVGMDIALIYAGVAFGAALALALIAQAVGIDRFLKPLAGRADAPGAAPWSGVRTEAARAGRAAVRLARSFGPLLLAGVAIGLAIEALVSPDAAARITGDNAAAAIPIAAALGTPLYFGTELFVPIAESLTTAGVGIGAVVALTIAGAGANVPEFVILSRLAHPRLIGAFVGFVFAVAMVGGGLAHAVA